MKNLFKEGELKLWQKYCDSLREKHPFSYLFWECTIKCNLSCKHCGSSCGPELNNNNELSFEEIKKAFFDIAQDFDAKKIMVAVTGGEPLLRRDIFEVMEYASNLGFKWGMVTNGTLIDSNIIDKLARAGMSTISVSLDGLEKSHNWLRGRPDTFKKTIRALKLLKDSNQFKVVEAITCVNQLNISELEQIYRLCEELNLDAWRLFIISPIGRAAQTSELFLNGKQLRYVLEFIKNKRRENRKMKVDFCDEGFLGTEYEGSVRDQLFQCWAGITVGSILYNGDIAACPILPREHLKQGNIKQDKFADIWNTKFGIFRDRNWRKVDQCQECAQWDFCQGNSLHLWDFNKRKLTLCHYNLLNDNKK